MCLPPLPTPRIERNIGLGLTSDRLLDQVTQVWNFRLEGVGDARAFCGCRHLGSAAAGSCGARDAGSNGLDRRKGGDTSGMTAEPRM